VAGLISDQLISNLRVVAYKQLITPVTVHRMVRGEGPYGTSETDTVVATTLCWYVPEYKGNLEVQTGGQIAHGSGAEVRFRFDEDIRVGDRLTIGGIADHVVQDVNVGATITLYLKAWTNRVE
jgi:hypothetical protein